MSLQCFRNNQRTCSYTAGAPSLHGTMEVSGGKREERQEEVPRRNRSVETRRIQIRKGKALRERERAGTAAALRSAEKPRSGGAAGQGGGRVGALRSHAQLRPGTAPRAPRGGAVGARGGGGARLGAPDSALARSGPVPPPAPEMTRQSRPPALSAAAAANKRDFSPRPAPRAPVQPTDWSLPPPPAGPRPLPALLTADWSAGGPGGGADWRPGRPSAGTAQGRGCTGAGLNGGGSGGGAGRAGRGGAGAGQVGAAGRAAPGGGGGAVRFQRCCSVRRDCGRCAPVGPYCGLRAAGGAGGGTAGPGCERGLSAGCGAPGDGAAEQRGAAIPARCVRAALVSPRLSVRCPSAFPWAIRAVTAPSMPPLPGDGRTAPGMWAVRGEKRSGAVRRAERRCGVGALGWGRLRRRCGRPVHRGEEVYV